MCSVSEQRMKLSDCFWEAQEEVESIVNLPSSLARVMHSFLRWDQIFSLKDSDSVCTRKVLDNISNFSFYYFHFRSSRSPTC